MVLTVTRDETLVESGLLSLSESAWEQARRQAEVTGPLAAMGLISHRAADDAGE